MSSADQPPTKCSQADAVTSGDTFMLGATAADGDTAIDSETVATGDAVTSGRFRRPDASMELLNEIFRDSVDPEYAADAAAGRQMRAPIAILLVCLLAGVLLASSAAQTRQGAPAAQQERVEIIRRVEAAQSAQQAQRDQLAALRSQVDQLQAGAGGAGSDQIVGTLGVLTGATACTGPGIVLTVRDANRLDKQGNVIDQDLRQIVNGLWQAGAESIAINGHRVTSRTAIREAGSAITVDYHSITSPYRLEAIGDPNKLPGAFAQTSGASWLNYLKTNLGVSWDLNRATSLTLPADQGLGTDRAKPVP